MNIKIISGGQTGADQAGLRAAKACGLETGGWMPGMFMTENGSDSGIATLYNLKQHEQPTYPPRTEQNVKECTGCLWFGSHTSPGGRLTLRLCDEQSKPFIIVPNVENTEKVTKYLVGWLQKYVLGKPNPVLMIAGNRESTHPGTGDWVERYLIELFTNLKSLDVSSSPERG